MDTVLINSLDDVRFTRVDSVSEFDEICRLHYHAYYSQGLIPKQECGYFDDAYDQQENAVNFALRAADVLVGAVRLVYFDPERPKLSTPARDAYADVLQAPQHRSKRIMDTNRFVMNRDILGGNRIAAVTVVKLALSAGYLWQADYGTATVRREHYAFYRRYIKAEEWASPRPYPSLLAELGLLICDFQRYQVELLKRFGLPSVSERAQFPGFCFRTVECGSLE